MFPGPHIIVFEPDSLLEFLKSFLIFSQALEDYLFHLSAFENAIKPGIDRHTTGTVIVGCIVSNSTSQVGERLALVQFLTYTCIGDHWYVLLGTKDA